MSAPHQRDAGRSDHGIRAPALSRAHRAALRDEGTSYHYLPPAEFAEAPDERLLDAVERALHDVTPVPVHRGAAWTTDAPYRETEDAISAARAKGALAVEMEAAALYAFARARQATVVCFAYVTNALARQEGDFEKGHEHGATLLLDVIAATARAWLSLEAGAEL